TWSWRASTRARTWGATSPIRARCRRPWRGACSGAPPRPWRRSRPGATRTTPPPPRRRPSPPRPSLPVGAAGRPCWTATGRAGPAKGLRLTRLGRRMYSEQVSEHRDPRGKLYYWIGAGPPAWEAGEDTDFAAVHAGYISVTPLHLDLTSYDGLRGLKPWETDFGAGRGTGRRRGRRTP